MFVSNPLSRALATRASLLPPKAIRGNPAIAREVRVGQGAVGHASRHVDVTQQTHRSPPGPQTRERHRIEPGTATTAIRVRQGVMVVRAKRAQGPTRRRRGNRWSMGWSARRRLSPPGAAGVRTGASTDAPAGTSHAAQVRLTLPWPSSWSRPFYLEQQPSAPMQLQPHEIGCAPALNPGQRQVTPVCQYRQSRDSRRLRRSAQMHR